MQRSMHVVKRNGSKESVSFDKVLRRIQKASRGLAVHPDALAQRVLSQIFDGGLIRRRNSICNGGAI
jgi:transcriptional regulator NrdR family protein